MKITQRLKEIKNEIKKLKRSIAIRNELGREVANEKLELLYELQKCYNKIKKATTKASNLLDYSNPSAETCSIYNDEILRILDT